MTPPIYPRLARQNGWEGTVQVRAIVLPSGKSHTLEIQKSSGFEILDTAAINAVRSWKFIPAYDGNIPVKSIVDVPVRFNLRQQG